MEAGAVLVAWLPAEVVDLRQETPAARTLVLGVPGWPGHRAGQHVLLRLTAEDGYQAQRSYSLASPPGREPLELTVQRLDGGELSPFLTEELAVGDRVEVGGPLGGYFVWDAAMGGPLLLVAGGAGMVPLMSMLRHRGACGARGVAARLLYSCRTWEEVLYRRELQQMAADDPGLELWWTLTRGRQPGPGVLTGRVGPSLLARVAWPARQQALAYVSGPGGFVEMVADGLVALGYPAERIRTERFGPSGP